MSKTLSPSAQTVQDALWRLGFPYEVRESANPTRSAQDAARLVGCEVGRIVKSLVFRGARTGRAVLVIASGANRVDEARLADLVGEPVAKADADFVREQTGFAIGGVPPLGHPNAIESVIDEDLLDYDEIWAAAGTPNALFRFRASDLVRMTGGRVVAIKVGSPMP
jgi:prolyl-tRNA editing enzyme YbaK/EbsC (Cys-tRNA(Pro) deacylase)